MTQYNTLNVRLFNSIACSCMTKSIKLVCESESRSKYMFEHFMHKQVSVSVKLVIKNGLYLIIYSKNISLFFLCPYKSK